MTINYEYKVGGGLPENAPSYVFRKADTEFYELLKEGEFCYIFNSRQMGKTSLLNRTMKRYQEEGFACVKIDLNEFSCDESDAEQWYTGIAYVLVKKLNVLSQPEDLFTWWDKHEQLSPVQRFQQVLDDIILPKISSNLIIFIDEIDRILSLKFSCNDFFALIRSCYDRRSANKEYNRLIFALIGVIAPSDLIDDKTRTPFNIGQAVQLSGFKEDEMEPLARGLMGRANNIKRVMKDVIYWTGGQPFLTQKVCKLILQKLSIESAESQIFCSEINTLDWVCAIIQEQVLNNWEALDEPVHLRTIRDRVISDDRFAGSLLNLYKQILLQGEVAVDGSSEQMRLRLTGLAVEQGGKLRVYNKIYENVFNLNWVESELDKLRPYADSFNAWVKSQYQDKSCLLQEEDLEKAHTWADGKHLSNDDYHFISASVEAELNQKVVEAEAKLNQFLEEEKKAKQRIRVGIFMLALSVIGAVAALITAGKAIREQRESLKIIQLERAGQITLRKFYRGEQVDSLVTAMQAAKELKDLVKDKSYLGDYPTLSPIFTLQEILLNINEQKTLQINYQYSSKSRKFSSLINVIFSSDGKTLASSNKDNHIHLWNVATGKTKFVLTGHQSAVNSVAFSPNGKIIASGSDDKTIKLWNTITGKQIASLSGHVFTVNNVKFNFNSKILASASDDKTIKLWDITTGKQIASLNGHQSAVKSVAFSPDGRIIASGSDDKTIKLWDTITGKQISSLAWHQSGVNSVAFSPDGKILASASDDKTIKLWDATTGKEKKISGWTSIRGQ